MIESLLDVYRDPLFVLFPLATFAVSTVAFIVFAAPLTWIAARAPASLERYRIQNRRVRAQEIVGPSVRSWLLNNGAMLAGVVLAWPLLRRTGVHAGRLPSWWIVGAELLFFVYLDDFLYYWFHRGMHAPWLFKRIHGWHHRIITPWAITGHYMHPLEYSLTAAVALIGPVLVGAHVVTVWLWLAFRQWEAAEGHCGYDFPWTPTHFLPGNDGAVHHDVHHGRVRGNYAGFLPIWDGVFGTYARGYRDELAVRRGATAAPARS